MSPADEVSGADYGAAAIPASPGAVVRKGSGEQAAAYIRRLIFDGQLQEGMRLPQDTVAKAVGVSRIPIREAIIALEREGWVTTKLHRGTFVNAFDEQIIRDHYELFGLVYGLAARRAAQRHDPEVLGSSPTWSSRCGPPTTWCESKSSPLPSTAPWWRRRAPPHHGRAPAMSRLVPGPFFVLVPKAVEPERKGLAAIVRAIRDGDGERAAREYTKMLSQQAEMVVDLFHERGGVRQAG